VTSTKKYGSRSDYARHRGVDKSTVTRWGKSDRLAFTSDGLVDFERSDALLAATLDPMRGHGLAIAAAADDFSNARHTNTRTDLLSPADVPEGFQTFVHSRALKEAELAKLAKMRREEQEGILIRRDQVKRDAEAIANIIKRGLEGIPSRVSPVLNAESDPGKRELLLEKEVNQILCEFSEAVARMQLRGDAPDLPASDKQKTDGE